MKKAKFNKKIIIMAPMLFSKWLKNSIESEGKKKTKPLEDEKKSLKKMKNQGNLWQLCKLRLIF